MKVGGLYCLIASPQLELPPPRSSRKQMLFCCSNPILFKQSKSRFTANLQSVVPFYVFPLGGRRIVFVLIIIIIFLLHFLNGLVQGQRYFTHFYQEILAVSCISNEHCCLILLKRNLLFCLGMFGYVVTLAMCIDLPSLQDMLLTVALLPNT